MGNVAKDVAADWVKDVTWCDRFWARHPHIKIVGVAGERHKFLGRSIPVYKFSL